MKENRDILNDCDMPLKAGLLLPTKRRRRKRHAPFYGQDASATSGGAQIMPGAVRIVEMNSTFSSPARAQGKTSPSTQVKFDFFGVPKGSVSQRGMYPRSRRALQVEHNHAALRLLILIQSRPRTRRGNTTRRGMVIVGVVQRELQNRPLLASSSLFFSLPNLFDDEGRQHIQPHLGGAGSEFRHRPNRAAASPASRKHLCL